MMAKLHVIESSDPRLEGMSFELTEGESTIGRDSASTIHINDSNVSRRHARIVASESGCVLIDSGSQNGIFIGTRRVQEHHLADGDTFRISRTSFRFEAPPDQAATIVIPLEPFERPAPAEPPRVPTVPAPPPVPAVPAPPVPPVPAHPSPATAPPPPPQAAPVATSQPAASPGPKPASGCSIGCLIASIVLFVATIGGSIFALYRAGYLP
ncbi:MAG TPA: FHA domain-containing protein [Thermoanaerobaculia bacterium]|nr:FHA domain-containing protein [Thermoanaerobaculia bacterium]